MSNIFYERDGTFVIAIYNKKGILLGEALTDLEEKDRVSELKWYRSTHGYAFTTYKIMEKRVWVSLHRFIIPMPYKDRKQQVDHINRNKMDCRKANLRVITAGQNMQNRGSTGFSSRNGKKTTSKYRGVYKCKNGRWRGQVMFEGKLRHIGYFDSELKAAIAWKIFRKKNLKYSED